MRDRLNDLVMAGTKVATAGLWRVEYEPGLEALDTVGERQVMLDSNGKSYAVVEIVRVEVHPFEEVTWEFADSEGEGFTSIEHWRDGHRSYYTRIGISVAADELVVCCWFRVVDSRDRPASIRPRAASPFDRPLTTCVDGRCVRSRRFRVDRGECGVGAPRSVVAAVGVGDSEQHVGVALLIETTAAGEISAGGPTAHVGGRERQHRVTVGDGPVERGDGVGPTAVGIDAKRVPSARDGPRQRHRPVCPTRTATELNTSSHGRTPRTLASGRPQPCSARRSPAGSDHRAGTATLWPPPTRAAQ